MPTYHRETWVDAPLDEVWEFHSRITGLTALTPDFLNLNVERVVGPDGEENPEVLEVGSRISMRLEPFGVLPGGSWTSVITEREYDPDAGRAYFRDTMEDGPFPHWEHTHRFYEGDDGETLVSDRVEYRLPGGELGELAGPVSGPVGFEPMFRYRHRETKRRLEE